MKQNITFIKIFGLYYGVAIGNEPMLLRFLSIGHLRYALLFHSLNIKSLC